MEKENRRGLMENIIRESLNKIKREGENIEEAISELKQADIQLINDVPLKGAEENRVVFIHPKSTGGVLVELVQKPK